MHRLQRGIVTLQTGRLLVLGVVLLGPFTLDPTAHAQVTSVTIDKCLSGKIKSVGESVAARTGCFGKEASRGVVDPSCHQKASDEFTGDGDPSKGAFNKLETKYPNTSPTPCLTFNDQGTFETTITSYADSVPGATGAAGKCDAAKIMCTGKYVAAVTNCASKAAGKTGTIDASCTQKAASELANGATACLDKAALEPDCTQSGSQAVALRGAADQFVEAALCALDPGNLRCPLTTYRVLALLMSQSPQDTTNALAQLNDLAADIARLSYNRVRFLLDVRVYQDTPAAMGCTGTFVEDDRVKITSYGVDRASADGVDISTIQHVIMLESQDLYPGCVLGGTSGGQGYGVTGIQPSTGVELMGSGWGFYPRILWAHEFLHGYGPNFGSHEAVLTCSGSTLYAQSSTQTALSNSSCTTMEVGPGGVPQGFNALGAWVAGQDLESGWNESAARKLYLQWITSTERYSISPSAAIGTYTFTIYAEDEGTPSAARPVTLQIPLAGAVPSGSSQSYVVEYRNSALIGPGSPPANVPGVYVHLMEVLQSGQMFNYLMKTGTDANNLSGIMPVALGVPVQLAIEDLAQPAGTTANISMTVQSVDSVAGTATITVAISRP